MTAVIYARYSSDNQREESIEGQIRECTAYAEKNGITVVKHYIDRALSAKTDNRPRCALVESEPERTQGLRQMLVDNYSVFYIVGEDAVSVARVLYSASDLVRRLRRMK